VDDPAIVSDAGALQPGTPAGHGAPRRGAPLCPLG